MGVWFYASPNRDDGHLVYKDATGGEILQFIKDGNPMPLSTLVYALNEAGVSVSDLNYYMLNDGVDNDIYEKIWNHPAAFYIIEDDPMEVARFIMWMWLHDKGNIRNHGLF